MFLEGEMMKTTLLSTVAAAALAMSFGMAHAQNDKSGAAPGGAMERGAPSGGMERGGAEQSPKAGSSAQAPAAQAPADLKGDRSAQGTSAQTPATNNGNKMSSDKMAPDNSAQKTGDAKQASPDNKSTTNAQSQAKTTVGAAPSAETKMTTEQRTQIREKVIATGPKVTNVNFSLNVGTVVPRTVRFAEVPPVIIDIHPEWRGYSYFIVNDQIIIVERDSLRIVAVLDV
jgi:hypothetical protein